MDSVIAREADPNKKTPVNLSIIDENYAKVLGKTWLNQGDDGQRTIFIKDLPVATTSDGTLICIPKTAEMGTTALVGLSGMGKTNLAGYLTDNIHWNWNDYIVNMNDSQEETLTWSECCDFPDFVARIKKVYQRPMPLPMIYVFPNSEDFKAREESLVDKNSLLVSIPFEEVLKNIEKYVPDLGNSLKYVEERKKELLEVRNEEELWDVIKSIGDVKTKGMDAVVTKVKASFKTLIQEGILNISNDTAPCEFMVKDAETKKIEYLGNPFTACMAAGCVPSFITSNLYGGKYKDAIFSYYIDCLFQENLRGYMKGRRVWIYFDELTKIVHIRPELNCSETEKALNNIVSRGRNNSISMLYATQGYNEIPRIIRSQTKYAIIFKHNGHETSAEICKDFALDKHWREDILKLKKFEVILATTDRFICYKENEKWEEPGPIKGMILPALHKNKFLNKII